MDGQRGAAAATRGSGSAPAFVFLTLEFHKEGRFWVGECRELGTATDGRLLEKVEAELAKLVALHLDGLEEIGESERVFQERGIKLYTGDAPHEIDLRMPIAKGNEHMLVQVKRVAVLQKGARLVAVSG